MNSGGGGVETQVERPTLTEEGEIARPTIFGVTGSTRQHRYGETRRPAVNN